MNGTLSTIKFSDIFIIAASMIGCFYILVLYDPPAKPFDNIVPSIEMNIQLPGNSADENAIPSEKMHVDFMDFFKESVV